MNYEYDVIVVGGGLGGTVAAISAARQGASVILLEKNTYLGGTATAGEVCEIDGSYSENGKTVIPAIAREIVERLCSVGAGKMYGQIPMSSNPSVGCDRIRFNPEMMKLVLDNMVCEAGVTCLFLTDIESVRQVDGGIQLVIANPYEKIELKGKTLIDSSGNSEALFKMDPNCTCKTKPEKLQGLTMIYRLGNVDKEKYMENLQPEELTRIILKGIEEKALPFRIMATCPLPGMTEISVSTTRAADVDFENIEDMTRGIMETRAQIQKSLPYLQSNMAGLENSYLSSIAASLGVRDRRKIIGLYEVTGEDLIETKKFDDTIALGCYPVDIHKQSGAFAVQFTKIGGDGIYSIPYRSIISKDYPNVICGGKAIFSDDVAFAAHRTMPTVMGIGNAAGIAAAIAAKEDQDIRTIDIKRIQRILVERDYGDCAVLF